MAAVTNETKPDAAEYTEPDVEETESGSEVDAEGAAPADAGDENRRRRTRRTTHFPASTFEEVREELQVALTGPDVRREY